MLNELTFKDTSESAILFNTNIPLILIKNYFEDCVSNTYGGAISAGCATLHVLKTCCTRCHAASTGSFIFSTSPTYSNDTACCLCSFQVPTSDDILAINNNIFFNRLNFSENWAKGSSSFQCYLSNTFKISFVTCSKSKESHIIEITDTHGGSINNLILFENSYYNSGLCFSASSYDETVLFSNCVFVRNIGSVAFLRIDNPVNVLFENCFYEGDAKFGPASSGVTKTICVTPLINVGALTRECNGAVMVESCISKNHGKLFIVFFSLNIYWC